MANLDYINQQMASPDYQGPLGQQQYFMGDREIGQGAYDQMQQLKELGSMGLLDENQAQQAMLGIMTSPQLGAGNQGQQAGYPGMGYPGMQDPYQQAMNGYMGQPQGMDVGDDEYAAYQQAQSGGGIGDMLGDITRNPIVMPLSSLAQRVPGAISSFKQAQQSEGGVPGQIGRELGQIGQMFGL